MPLQTTEAQQALVQEINANRTGLVADELFPLVETPEKFAVIDWSKELKNLREEDDAVDCKTDAREVDSDGYSTVLHQLKGHALIQSLCVEKDHCYDQTQVKKVLSKTRQLANKLLLAREKRAIDLVTTTGNYTAQTGKKPSDSTAKVNGGYFTETRNTFFGSSFDVLAYLQGLNDNTFYGQFNKAVMSRGMLNSILAHPSVIGSSYNPVARTSKEVLEELLGVKIVIADAVYNDGVGANLDLKRVFPADSIVFTRSYDLVSSDDYEFVFGIGAYSQNLEVFEDVVFKKGIKNGSPIQKIGHNITEVVASYKAAALIKLS